MTVENHIKFYILLMKMDANRGTILYKQKQQK